MVCLSGMARQLASCEWSIKHTPIQDHLQASAGSAIQYMYMGAIRERELSYKIFNFDVVAVDNTFK